MSRINSKFEELRAKGEKALVGFVTAGDPTVPASLKVIRRMCEGGLDVLELGVPFSDPTADGPVIQRSSARALKAGMRMQTVLKMIQDIRNFSDIPIVVFSYYNPILAYGASRFYDDAVSSGADGVLIVDLPPEESAEMVNAWSGNELDLIRLVAPTTPHQRMAVIAEKASGFLYMVSMTGVTGSGGIDLKEISTCTDCLRTSCKGIPICIGFGISSSEQVKAIAGFSDGVVIGSAFERIIESNLSDAQMADKVGEAVRSFKEATMCA